MRSTPKQQTQKQQKHQQQQGGRAGGTAAAATTAKSAPITEIQLGSVAEELAAADQDRRLSTATTATGGPDDEPELGGDAQADIGGGGTEMSQGFVNFNDTYTYQ
jgi:hypothetical protein